MSGEDAPRPCLENLIVLEIKTNKQAQNLCRAELQFFGFAHDPIHTNITTQSRALVNMSLVEQYFVVTLKKNGPPGVTKRPGDSARAIPVYPRRPERSRRFDSAPAIPASQITIFPRPNLTPFATPVSNFCL
jgi:hypothetical protein